jgi:hypothetical protein
MQMIGHDDVFVQTYEFVLICELKPRLFHHSTKIGPFQQQDAILANSRDEIGTRLRIVVRRQADGAAVVKGGIESHDRVF